MGKDLGRGGRGVKHDSNIVHEKILIEMNKYKKSFCLSIFLPLI